MSAQQKDDGIGGPVLPLHLLPDSQLVRKNDLNEMKIWPNETFSEMVRDIFYCAEIISEEHNNATSINNMVKDLTSHHFSF